MRRRLPPAICRWLIPGRSRSVRMRRSRGGVNIKNEGTGNAVISNFSGGVVSVTTSGAGVYRSRRDRRHRHGDRDKQWHRREHRLGFRLRYRDHRRIRPSHEYGHDWRDRNQRLRLRHLLRGCRECDGRQLQHHPGDEHECHGLGDLHLYADRHGNGDEQRSR